MRQAASDALDWIKPDRDSAQSMQLQIAQWLQSLIETGRLSAGDRLPAETVLVERLGVSRVTVRLAIDDLVARGLITRSHGRGSFVSNTAVKHDLLSERGFFDALLANALEPEARLLSYRQAVPPAAIGALFGAAGISLPRIERLYVSAGRPIATTVGWLTADAAGLTHAQVETRSTATIHTELLRRPVVTSTVRIGAELAGRGAGKRLMMPPHAAVLVLSRSRFDAGGQLRDHSRFIINPAAYEVTLTTNAPLPAPGGR